MTCINAPRQTCSDTTAVGPAHLDACEFPLQRSRGVWKLPSVMKPLSALADCNEYVMTGDLDLSHECRRRILVWCAQPIPSDGDPPVCFETVMVHVDIDGKSNGRIQVALRVADWFSSNLIGISAALLPPYPAETGYSLRSRRSSANGVTSRPRWPAPKRASETSPAPTRRDSNGVPTSSFPNSTWCQRRGPLTSLFSAGKARMWPDP